MATNRGGNKREGCGGGREEKRDGDESEMVRVGGMEEMETMKDERWKIKGSQQR